MALPSVSSVCPAPVPASFCDGTTDLPTVPDVTRCSEVVKDVLKKLTEFSGDKLEAAKYSHSLLSHVLIQVSPAIFDKLRNISSEELADLLQFCPSLQSLDLAGFHQITTEIALPIISGLNRLTSLNLCGTQVTNLRPLIDNPLPFLITVNFYQTNITYESLLEFLEKHTICSLTPPRDPPTGFFEKDKTLRLTEVKLHITKWGSGNTISYREITKFLKTAPKLRKVWLWITDNVEFKSKQVLGAPTPREFFIDCKIFKNTFYLTGKDESIQI